MDDFKVSAGRDPRGKVVVGGDGEVVGRVTDMWVDVPEQMVRYLTVDLNPEGSGKTRLIPMTLAKIGTDRVTVKSLYGKQLGRRSENQKHGASHRARGRQDHSLLRWRNNVRILIWRDENHVFPARHRVTPRKQKGNVP